MCDLDDTLVERPPLFRSWAEEFAAASDPAADPSELVEWLVEQDRGGHRPRHEFAAAVLGRLEHDVPVEDFVAENDRQVSGRYRLTPGVRAALDEVRAAGWKVAVVTNGPVLNQSTKIRSAGLDELVDAVCISQEVGAPKPDRSMFEAAAERAGATLEGAWMIGDNLDADIAGAQGVGARSVWIKRPDDWLTYSSGTEPDLVAESFDDALRQILAATA
jgi:putative hydrolase of the HAD superfamily